MYKKRLAKRNIKIHLFYYITIIIFRNYPVYTCNRSIINNRLIHNLIGGLIGVIIYESLKRFVSESKIDLINKYTLYVIIPISAFAIVSTLIHIKYYL